MTDVFRKLIADFLSTIAFLIVFAASGDVVIATGFAVASALAQIGVARWRGQSLNTMTWASLALVLALGGATLFTNDARFVLMKPSIAHFAIGAIMLKRGWMTRYMPPIVLDNAPDLPVIAGYCWAALMFALGAGTIAVALTGDLTAWGIYVAAAGGAKAAAFGVQYVVFRVIVGRRIKSRQAALVAANSNG
jgi:intracellular septation protein A